MARIVGSIMLFVVGYFGGRIAMTAVMGGGKTSGAKTTYSTPVPSGVSSNPFVD